MRMALHILLSLLLTGALVLGTSKITDQQLSAHRKENLQEQADITRARLETALNERLHMVRGLTAFVKSNESFSEAEFLRFAHSLEENRPGILSLQLAPNAVVQYLTHPETNEAARGHDLLGDPARRHLVQAAIEGREYLIAGPLQLIQGGSAIIGRLPIFKEDTDSGVPGADRFWGFATLLIDIDQLLLEAGISDSSSPLSYALRGKDGKGALGDQFFGPEGAFEEPGLVVDVAIPNGTWQLAVLAGPGWSSVPTGLATLRWGGWMLSAIAGWLLFVLLRRPESLRRAVGEATQALSEREEQLRHSQKLEAIGQLTGGLAHDFNNLLAVILGNLELLALTESIEDDAKAFVEMAKSAVDRGSELTRSLLAFSRKQSLQSTVCDLSAQLDPMIEILNRTLGRSIRIQTDFAPGLPPVRIDVSQLETVLLSLAINARDAMPNGGELKISTRSVECSKQRGELEPGSYVQFSIQDDGIGMSAEALEQAFEPFYTTKPGQGTGLGLSMIYGFVKQSGGHIELISKQGVGTQVQVLFPISNEALPAPLEVPAPFPAALAEQASMSSNALYATVLVAEDDPQVRRLVISQLTSIGIHVLESKDADSACRAHVLAERVDLLLTDIIMPGKLNGYDLAAKLRRRQPDLKVLFMSGYDQFGKHGEKVSGPLLRKPFRRADLERAIREVLDKELDLELFRSPPRASA